MDDVPTSVPQKLSQPPENILWHAKGPHCLFQCERSPSLGWLESKSAFKCGDPGIETACLPPELSAHQENALHSGSFSEMRHRCLTCHIGASWGIPLHKQTFTRKTIFQPSSSHWQATLFPVYSILKKGEKKEVFGLLILSEGGIAKAERASFFCASSRSWLRVEEANLCVRCPVKDINGLLMEEEPSEEQVRQMGEAAMPARPPFLLIWSSTGELWPIKTLSQDAIMTPILDCAATAARIQIKRQCETPTSAAPSTPQPHPFQYWKGKRICQLTPTRLWLAVGGEAARFR